MTVLYVYLIWLLAVSLAGDFGLYLHAVLFGGLGLRRYLLAQLWIAVIAGAITLGVFLTKGVLL